MEQITLEPIQWTTLPDIDDVAPINDNDHAVLQEIRQVLQKHGYMERFGVCLLHRHFDLKEDECLMEYTDTENKTQTLVVEKKLAPSADKIETMWRFSHHLPEVTLCEKQCSYSSGHKQVHVKVGR
jgi:hypothetical protein